MKIAVITEEGLLKIHKFERCPRESEDIEEFLYTEGYDLNSINWQVIEDIEIDELFEVFISTPNPDMSINKEELRFFIDLDTAKEYYKLLVNDTIEMIEEDKNCLDEEMAVCLLDVVSNDYLEHKNIDEIIEELEDEE